MAIILDGKKLSQEILENLRKKIRNSGMKLKLIAVLVGDDKNSKIFLRQKEKACEFVGVDFQLYRFPKDISQKSLEKEIKTLRGKICHGIIIQLPLPKHIDAQKILNLIPPEKDVDLLSEKSQSGTGVLPPVLAAIVELFEKYRIKVKGKNAAVIGRGKLVGEPVIDWLRKQGAMVSVVSSKTVNISSITRKADILISGVGKSGLITGDMIKNGAVVVDAAGDIDFETVSKKAGYITPIFGGVGPLTVAMVIKNLLLLNDK